MTETSERDGERELEGRDIVNWVIAGVIVALLGINVLSWWQPTGPGHLVGSEAPSVELPVLGEERRVGPTTYDDQIVVLDFWATWCPPCLDQVEQLRRAASNPEFEGVEILSVNVDEPSSKRLALVRDYVDKNNVPFTTLIDGRGDGPSAREAYRVGPLPTLVVIGPDGRVQYAESGVHSAEQLTAEIERIRSDS